MAADRAQLQNAPHLTRRMVEWMIVAGAIGVLALVFAQRVRVVQGQVELAAVKSTLGALRTAFVIEYVHQKVAAEKSSVALQPINPFELLEHQPSNYHGEMGRLVAPSAPGGSWVFDPVCACVGYLPMDAEWLDSPSGDRMAWYRVSGAPGPLQLTAKEAYVWQGKVMNY